MFRLGDIVEVQMSFVVFPVKAGRSQMKLILRSIALLNGSFSQVGCNIFERYHLLISIQVACVERLRQNMKIPLAPRMLKRRIGYDEDGMAADAKRRAMTE